MSEPEQVQEEKQEEAQEKPKVYKPTQKQLLDAKQHKSKTFAKLIREKDILLRSEVNKAAKDRGLWDDKLQKELEAVRQKIIGGEAQLARGGRTRTGETFTKSQAKQLALDMMTWRSRYLELHSVLQEFDQYTVESQAENEEFDYLCSVCIEGVESLEDYRSRADELEEQAAELAKLITNYDDGWYDKLPEVSFLKKYNFIDDKYRLVNEDGHLVDEEGNLVNEDGQLVNEQGELVNEFGEKVDQEGNNVDFVEFPD